MASVPYVAAIHPAGVLFGIQGHRGHRVEVDIAEVSWLRPRCPWPDGIPAHWKSLAAFKVGDKEGAAPTEPLPT